MESSPASAEVKGSMQAEEEERRKRKQREKKIERGREEEVGVRVKQQQEKAGMQNRSTKCTGTDAVALYLPMLSPLEAPSSLAAWRAGRLTAGQTGYSASSRHCRQEKKMFSDSSI